MKYNQAGSNQKYVLSTVSSGLCNRLKNLISVMRIAEIHGRKPAVFWPKDNDVYCHFNELFQNQIETISSRGELKRLYKSESWAEYRHYPERCPNVDYLVISSWRLLVSKDEVPSGFALAVPSMSRNDIDFEYERIPLDVRLSRIALINRLMPVVPISERIGEIAAGFDADTVSVHIRSWVDAKSRSDQVFDFNAYASLMDQFDQSQNFFISCDSDDVLERMINKYGSRILHFPKKTLTGDRLSEIGIQEALIDLYLLAKNKILISSYMSTFSEFAWWLGSCSADVHVVGGGGDIREKIMKSDSKKRKILVIKNLLYKPYLNFRDVVRLPARCAG